MPTSAYPAMVLALLLLQAGCALPWLGGTEPVEDQPQAAAQDSAAELLSLGATLAIGDEGDHQAVTKAVLERFEESPTALNRLKRSIVQTLTHRSQMELDQARADLRLLLSFDGALTPSEQDIARIYLAQIERELRHTAEVRVLEHRAGHLERRVVEMQNQIDLLRSQIRRLTEIERAIDRDNMAERMPGTQRAEAGDPEGPTSEQTPREEQAQEGEAQEAQEEVQEDVQEEEEQ